MHKTKKADLILALLMAIALWAYVLGELDPVKTTIMRNVPIEFQNEDILTQEGMIVTEKDVAMVSITYSGKRSNISSLEAGDFKVTCDLSQATVGENELAVKVTAPSYLEVANVSSKHVNVSVEELVTETKPVEVIILNQNSDDSEPYVVHVSKNKISVSGAKSLVTNVAKVEARLDSNRVENELKALSVDIVPVDSNGETVQGVSLSDSSVSVSAIMHNKKTVQLVTQIVGLDSGSVTRNVSVPKVITIKGTDDILRNISAINAEPIDVSQIYENCEITVSPQLPEGVTAAVNSQDLVAEITVYNAGFADYEFDQTNVDITGVADGSIVIIEDTEIKVSVKGQLLAIEAISQADFKLMADVSGLQYGEHSVPITCETMVDGLDSIIVEPEYININIEKAPDESIEGTDTNLIDNIEEE